MTSHLEGRPVNASTYQYHGCRCDGCRTASTEKTQRLRKKNGMSPSVIANGRAVAAAATWVRANHPDVWQAIYDEKYEQALKERPQMTPSGPKRSAA